MLAAFMSTHDSYLLAWSSVLTQDIVAPLCKRELSQQARLTLTRVFIVLIGLFLLVWGLWYELPGTMWNYLAITGTMYLSGTLALMVGGMYWKRANVTGAYCAIGLGVLFPLLQLFLNPWIKRTVGFEISAGTAGLLAYLVAQAGMVLGSLCGEWCRARGGDLEQGESD